MLGVSIVTLTMLGVSVVVVTTLTPNYDFTLKK